MNFKIILLGIYSVLFSPVMLVGLIAGMVFKALVIGWEHWMFWSKSAMEDVEAELMLMEEEEDARSADY